MSGQNCDTKTFTHMRVIAQNKSHNLKSANFLPPTILFLTFSKCFLMLVKFKKIVVGGVRNTRHKDFRPFVRTSPFVTLVLPPLDSETGWTGELRFFEKSNFLRFCVIFKIFFFSQILDF